MPANVNGYGQTTYSRTRRKRTMRLLLFTGGGIAPALNPTIVGVVQAARKRGWDVVGGRNGWACLASGETTDLGSFSQSDLDLISRTGGTLLGTSRTNPFKHGPTEAEVDAIGRYDAVIAVGGDDTLGAAHKAAEIGFPVVGIPKTIDNDLSATHFTPGFPTAAHVIANTTKAVKQAAIARGKVHVIETLGGKAGWLTAAAAVGGADLIVPPERPVELGNLLSKARELYARQGHAIVVISHNAQLGLSGAYATEADSFGHERPFLVALPLREQLEQAVGVEVKVVVPGNVPSGSDPIELDRTTALALGERAVRLIADGAFGRMASVAHDLSVTDCSLEAAVGKYRSLTDAEFNWSDLKPTGTYLDYLGQIIGRRSEPYFNLIT